MDWFGGVRLRSVLGKYGTLWSGVRSRARVPMPEAQATSVIEYGNGNRECDVAARRVEVV